MFTARLAAASLRSRPKSRLADFPRILLPRILLNACADLGCFANQHKNQVVFWKMFFDYLFRDFGRHCIHTRFQLIDFIIAQSIKLVSRDAFRKLLGSFYRTWKLPLDVSL